MVKRMLLVIALVCAGCGLDKEYVKRDRATFDAVAPLYQAYLRNDSDIDDDDRDSRLDTVLSWEERLLEAEKSLGLSKGGE